MNLASEFNNYIPPENKIALWWLGQSGYLLKTPESVSIALDPYLSDSLAFEPEFPLKRLMEPLFDINEIKLDLYICTHSHPDHADIQTIKNFKAKDKTRFLAPGGTKQLLESAGVKEITVVWPSYKFEYRDISVTAAFALPTDDSDLSPVGYLINLKNGPRLFFSGDTDNHPLIYSNSSHKPDVCFVCINGTFNNLSHWEAAEYCAALNPKVAIPCHYGLFKNNNADPHQFMVSLKKLAPAIEYQQLEYGKLWTYPMETV